MVVFASKGGFVGCKAPRIIRTIVHDATVYFLVIFTSHFVFEMSLLLLRVSGFTFDAMIGELLRIFPRQTYSFYRVGKCQTFLPTNEHALSVWAVSRDTSVNSGNYVWVSIEPLWTPFSLTKEIPFLRFLPVMIGRLTLSLRKAADPSNSTWSLVDLTSSQNQECGTSECSHELQFAPTRSDEGSV